MQNENSAFFSLDFRVDFTLISEQSLRLAFLNVSSSAGHGNLFHESYTSTMERVLKPILAKIGLDFQTRPYSMGGHDVGTQSIMYTIQCDTIYCFGLVGLTELMILSLNIIEWRRVSAVHELNLWS